MRFYSHPSTEKFLGVFGGPFSGCVCGLTLKQGYWIFALLCLIELVASAYSLTLRIVLTRISLNPGFIFSAKVLYDLCTITQGISAAFGLRGLYELDVRLITQFYLVNIGLIPLGAVLTVMLYWPTPKTETAVSIQVFSVIVGACVSIIFGLVIAKVIWSVGVHIKNNEAMLVMYGKDAAELVAHQQQILSQVEAVPGRPSSGFELGRL